MAADGSQPTRLTRNSAIDVVSAWSPDGTQIAFVSDRDGNWETYVMAADGSQPTRLTRNDAWDRYHAWSPDGTQIAFVSNRDGNEEIYVMAAKPETSGDGGGDGGDSVSDDGACTAGLVVNPGESCTYKDETFSVSSDGRGSIAFFSAGNGLSFTETTVNGVQWNFVASKNSDSNSWTIHTAE